VIELLVSPIAAGIFGLISLAVGKRLDNHLKAQAEAKREEKVAEVAYKRRTDERHNKLFEAFIAEQQKAAVAFEGISRSVGHIGEELAEMRIETRDFRSEIFTRISQLESVTARHEGILTSR